MKKKDPACPCTSGASYRACCRRFHDGDEPADARELVRSRFSAFALGRGEYLFRTLHPDNRQRDEPEDEVVRDFSRARQTFRYRGLTIHDANLGDSRAEVLFTARVFVKGRDRSFLELSRFERVDDGWRYLDGFLWQPNELVDVELTIEALNEKRPRAL